jgi:hypothetical protein
MKIIIEDIIHAEWQPGEFPTIADAFAELERRAAIPWNEHPNRAPCTSWKTCGRTYHIIEYDDSAATAWEERQRIPVLEISVAGVKWLMKGHDETETQKNAATNGRKSK